jgi:hypothetical protein
MSKREQPRLRVRSFVGDVVIEDQVERPAVPPFLLLQESLRGSGSAREMILTFR